jgi:hypothetical protein
MIYCQKCGYAIDSTTGCCRGCSLFANRTISSQLANEVISINKTDYELLIKIAGAASVLCQSEPMTKSGYRYSDLVAFLKRGLFL